VTFSRLRGDASANRIAAIAPRPCKRERFRDASIARFLSVTSRMSAASFSLLRILADGEVHNAERIGRALGLSRIEVEALGRDLEALGLSLHKPGGTGYRLEAPIDLYDVNLLTEQVSTVAPGLRLEILDECVSTNTELAIRARAGAEHGTVLVCEHQSAGRGRRGNAWVSAIGGSVTFSMLWRFSLGAGRLAGLSLAVAVAAAKALEKLGIGGIAVKWPNDLFRGDRKLGGILIETTGDAAGATAAIIGIGVNTRLRPAERERIGRPAADIASSPGVIPSRTAVLVGLLESVAASLELFSGEGFAPFREAWLSRHAWQGRQVVLSLAENRVAEGRVVGVADDGALELTSAQGIKRFHAGELSLSLE
jgi:BirA family biotin operon repressor/biotin-[acetyl-CoA-carboxylase] ligase